jgi:hypothetical protein
MKIELAQ